MLLCDDTPAVDRARTIGLTVVRTLVLQAAHPQSDLASRTDFRLPSRERLSEIVRDAHTLRPSKAP